MAITSSSYIFDHDQMIAGTAVNTWIATHTITTFHDAYVTPIGSAKVLYTIVYE